jgi:hypothetical protein
MAEEEALVRVEEVDEVPVEVRTAPHLGQQARLTRHHPLQLNITSIVIIYSVLDPDLARSIFPDPDLASSIFPDPDSARSIFPDPDMARSIFLDPDSARSIQYFRSRRQCCGSGMFILDPESEFCYTGFRDKKIPDPGSGSASKNFKPPVPYKLLKSSMIWIRIFFLSDLGGRKSTGKGKIATPTTPTSQKFAEKKRRIFL